MHMIDRFLGRDVSDWIDIEHTLESHNIKNAAELNSRLGARRIIDRTLRVVDSKNHKRVLGNLKLRSTVDIRMGSELRAAVSPRRAYMERIEPWDCDIRSVRFGVERETDDGGWTYTPYLSTDNALEDLMMVEEFLLPGETERQAYERRWRGR